MQSSTVLLFLGELGGGEIMVILVAVLVLFGANKIPGIARSLGSGIREFKDATNGIRQEIERSVNEEAPARQAPAPAKPLEVKPGAEPGLRAETSQASQEDPASEKID